MDGRLNFELCHGIELKSQRKWENMVIITLEHNYIDIGKKVNDCEHRAFLTMQEAESGIRRKEEL